MKKISYILTAAVLAAVLTMGLSSCGGNDNKGATDGTVTVGMNDGNSTASGNGNSTAAGNGTDILDGTAGRSR